MWQRSSGVRYAAYVALIFALAAFQLAIVYLLWAAIPPALGIVFVLTAQPLARRLLIRFAPVHDPVRLNTRRCYLFMGITLALLVPFMVIATVALDHSNPGVALLGGVPAAFAAHMLLERLYHDRSYLNARVLASAE